MGTRSISFCDRCGRTSPPQPPYTRDCNWWQITGGINLGQQHRIDLCDRCADRVRALVDDPDFLARPEGAEPLQPDVDYSVQSEVPE